MTDIDLIVLNLENNVAADVMSRYPPPEISPSDEEDVLVGLIPAWLSETLPNECQDYEEYLNEVVNYLRNPTYKRGIPEKVVKRSQRFRLNEQGELFRRVSDNRYLKVPPIKERIKILREVHDGHGHFGKDATWHVYIQVTGGQPLTTRQKTTFPLAISTVPINQLFERFAVDYVGPLPKSADGNQYIIVAVEYYTRWPIARAVAQANSETTIKFLYEEIFTCFGPPTHILSDNGTHFVSQDVEAFIKFVNTHHQYATPYHPQTNGRVEQFNGTLVRGIKKMTATHPKIWDTYLHSILYAYRTKCHQSIGISPYELLYGIPPRSPNEDILQQIGRKMGFERSFFLQQRQLADEDNSKEPEKQSNQVNSKQLPVGSEVLRLNQLKKHKLDYNYRNQVYTVLASLKNNVYILANRHGKRLKRAINGAHLRRFVRPQPQQMLLENNGGWMKSSTQTFKTQNNSLNANDSNGSQI
ncbi:hypothetical protein G6F66_012218 [Rhizopus arrhizus]|nr:hypothetical protein G6F66_012218 [Rhizopus arrhizus]